VPAGVAGLRGAKLGGGVGAAHGSVREAPGAARGSAGENAPGAAHGSAGVDTPTDAGTRGDGTWGGGPAGRAGGVNAEKGVCDSPIGAGTKSVESSKKSYA
jgi:hypothetical protein